MLMLELNTTSFYDF
jgi:hypothetical protein